jgi:hypothetical protein
VTDEQKVCSIFNTFFQSIGSDIGIPENNDKPLCDIIGEYSNHESVKCIKEQIKGNSHMNNFTLRFVTERETINIMKSPYQRMPQVMMISLLNSSKS